MLAGRILKIWGNRGEVVLDPADDSPVAIHAGDCVILKSSRHSRSMTVAGLRLVNGRWLVRLDGVDNISQALPLVGYELFAEAAGAEAEGPEPPIGYEVIDSAGESWGRVTYLHRKPAPLLEVLPPGGGEPRLIPYNEHIVVSVDRRRRQLRIDPPAGLKELNG
jgi:ribosomal 30S subunit maturation factor RimM